MNRKYINKDVGGGKKKERTKHFATTSAAVAGCENLNSYHFYFLNFLSVVRDLTVNVAI
jgi:hypothetical protein